MAAKKFFTGCEEIDGWLRRVDENHDKVHKRQILFVEYVRKCFKKEKIVIDQEKLEISKNMLKYFPFDVFFDWEWCLFALFFCCFKEDGDPRWSDLVAFMGRGGGKNGFIAFLSFYATTPTHGISKYDVDICANSEDQAKRSFDDVWEMMEGDKARFKKSFSWTKEEIVNKATKSKFKYRTNSPKSKDGMRSGIVIFDEVHAYTDYRNITVFTTGQGKVAHPRRAFISSNGDVRDGVYDRMIERCDRILSGEIDDNGYLPFICALDDPDEVHHQEKHVKACPSLFTDCSYTRTLKKQILKEYRDWLEDPVENSDFMTKRMGIPQGDKEHEVTSWDNLKRASRPVGDLSGKSCVLGLDFARKNDFLSACLLFKDKDNYSVVHHSWFCAQSPDRGRIKPPLDEWAKAGIITMVDEVEVPTALVMNWIRDAMDVYSVEAVAIDDYRYDIVREGLEELGFSCSDKTITRVRPSNHMRVQPVINSAFLTDNISWGEDPAMRWFTNNTKIVPFLNGNYKYEKIEPRSRKTDGFMALVAAFCIADQIQEEFSAAFLPSFTF